MEISDQDLRAMVRDAIARHGQPHRSEPTAPLLAPPDVRVHASHGLLALVTGGDPDGRCLIEPAVRCTHCGYCQSMGH
jgi:hypothetical protein